MASGNQVLSPFHTLFLHILFSDFSFVEFDVCVSAQARKNEKSKTSGSEFAQWLSISVVAVAVSGGGDGGGTWIFVTTHTQMNWKNPNTTITAAALAVKSSIEITTTTTTTKKLRGNDAFLFAQIYWSIAYPKPCAFHAGMTKKQNKWMKWNETKIHL